MGMPKHANTASGITLTTTAETVAATITPAFATNNPTGEGVEIWGKVNVTAGTGTTAIVVRLRQGTGTTGTLIGTAETHTLAAGASATVPFDGVDTATLVTTGIQYVVTVQQTAATGNGTVNAATIACEDATSFE